MHTLTYLKVEFSHAVERTTSIYLRGRFERAERKFFPSLPFFVGWCYKYSLGKAQTRGSSTPCERLFGARKLYFQLPPPNRPWTKPSKPFAEIWGKEKPRRWSVRSRRAIFSLPSRRRRRRHSRTQPKTAPPPDPPGTATRTRPSAGGPFGGSSSSWSQREPKSASRKTFRVAFGCHRKRLGELFACVGTGSSRSWWTSGSRSGPEFSALPGDSRTALSPRPDSPRSRRSSGSRLRATPSWPPGAESRGGRRRIYFGDARPNRSWKHRRSLKKMPKGRINCKEKWLTN